jgi:hypothetical protein
MIGETREAIEAYCVAVGLLVYEWNDLHEKLARLFALVREGDGQETLTEWYAVRSVSEDRIFAVSLVEIAFGHRLTACYKIRAVVCSLPRA